MFWNIEVCDAQRAGSIKERSRRGEKEGESEGERERDTEGEEGLLVCSLWAVRQKSDLS